MIVIGTPATKNTEFLFTSYVLDYHDNYHRQMGEPTSELEKEARQLRRRYKNQQQYLEAIAVYDEYMALIYQKYGGKELFKIRFESETVPDFIPHKPRMKNTKFNRLLEKNEIVISDPIKTNFDIDLDGMEEIATMQADENVLKYLHFDDNYKIKEAEKIIKTGQLSISAMNYGSGDPIDYLERWFMENRTKNPDRNKVVKAPSLTELYHEHENPTQDEGSDEDILYFRGQLMGRKTIEQLQTMDRMNEFGWNSLKIMRSKDKNGQITKILKKKKKREKQQAKKRKHYNDFMGNLYGDNYGSFEDYEMDMLDFTTDQLFK